MVTTLQEEKDYFVDTMKNHGLVSPPYNTPWFNYTPGPSSSILIRFTAGFAPSDPWWLTDGRMVLNGMRWLINSWFSGKLPFEKGLDPTTEYPFGLSRLLSQGAVILVG